MRNLYGFVAILAFAGVIGGCPTQKEVAAADREICDNGRDDDGDGDVDESPCPVEADAGPEEDGGDECVDEDGDGYGEGCAAGQDCDDSDVDVNPGEEEVCTDRTEVDEDCDGEANEDDSECDRIEECEDDEDCDDDEECRGGNCVGVECSEDEDCSDGIACTDEDCVDGECDVQPRDSRCDEDEVCDPGDRDADSRGCVATDECEDDEDCGSDEVCDAGECVEVECDRDSDCDDDIECTVDDCDSNACVHRADSDRCGALEICNPDDPDADRDGCVRVAECDRDSDCDDGLFCNGEEQCDDGVCEDGDEPDCDDGVACTEDSCSEALDRCRNTADHDFCADRGDDLCDPEDPDADVAGCVSLECSVDADCSDGQFCNGAEWCGAGNTCHAGTAVVCNDGNAGTSDACDEATDRCVYEQIFEVCGNGLDDDHDGVIDDGCVQELCTDIIDNDGDGVINENCAEICGDTIDNDRDGFTDEGCGGGATRRVVITFTTEGSVVFDRLFVNGCYGHISNGQYICDGPARDAEGRFIWGEPINAGCASVDASSVICTVDVPVATTLMRFNPHYYDIGGAEVYGCEGLPNRDRDEDPGTVTITVDGVAVTFDDGDGSAEVREYREVSTDFAGGCNLELTLG